MWILIVMQLTAGSATAHNSFPIVYSGVAMQEFSSSASCKAAKRAIQRLDQRRGESAGQMLSIRPGIVTMECVRK